MKILVYSVVALILWLLFTMFRNPVMLKMSFRNAFRRKAETLLVVLGSLIGTALIVGSMAMNDSFQKFLYSRVEYSYGEIDEILRPADDKPYFESKELKEHILKLVESDLIDGVVPIISKNVTVGIPGETRKLNPEKTLDALLVGADFEELQSFGSGDNEIFAKVHMKNGDIVGAVVNKNLAQALGIKEGDLLEILPDPSYRLLTWKKLPIVKIISIVDGKGLVNYSGGEMTPSAGTLFLDASAARKVLGVNVPEAFSEVLVSNKGDYLEGETLTEKVAELIKSNSGNFFEIENVKSDAISRASQGNVGLIFLALSLFAIVAGVFLLINIYIMLAEERKVELGTLRAIGFKKSEVSKVIIFEGFFYSLFAALAGIPTGLLITKFILTRFVNLVNNISTLVSSVGSRLNTSTFETTFNFYVKPSTLVYGFLLGMLIPMLVTLYAGRKISKMNIVRAVRNMPEEFDSGTRSFKVLIFVAAIFSTVVSYLSYRSQNATLFVLGIVFVLFTVSLAMPVKRKRILVSLFSIGTLIFVFWSNSIDFVSKASSDSISLIAVKGFSILLAVMLLGTYNLKFFEWLLLKLFKHSGKNAPTLKISIAFPSRNRLTTALTIAMYAIVVYIITIISIIPYTQERHLLESRNLFLYGYDVYASSLSGNTTLSATELISVEGISAASKILVGRVRIRTESGKEKNVNIYLLDDGFAKGSSFSIKKLETFDDLKGAKSNIAILWEYIMSHANVAVISGSVLNDIAPGDKLEILSLSSSRLFTGYQMRGEFERNWIKLEKPMNVSIAGVIPEDTLSVFNGIFLYYKNLPAEIRKQIDSAMFFVKLNGSDYEEKKRNYDRFSSFAALSGMISIFVDDVLNIITSSIKGIVEIFRSFLYFGMFVGIVGTAITMFKAFYRRKRIIGILKAIGFTQNMVFSSFWVEASFSVILGLLMGFITGTLTTYEMFTSPAMEGMSIYIPWSQLFIMGLSFYIISLLSTLIPSYLASRLPPAEAIRYFE
ncbi:hypothetical protein IX53_06045 [Kosmotoga pacifica]|uniref:ABC3 transporter permease C-terminal domain-containing protein n=1 Tax=Kosmotoga pacifica TaxID=1330330 RepID=A0A0G2ZHN0_9BACT|nr:hypothetical protein IX53_06045 [Kosmotoga pacifica]